MKSIIGGFLMDFIKKNIKIVIGVIILVIIAIVTFITLFIGNNEEKVTTESETTVVENNQENATNDKMVSDENEDAPVATVNNDSSVSTSPAIDVSEPYKGTHFEWQPSNDLFFIHPDSQYIANENFDNDNEAPLDEAKAKAGEDCSVLGGTVSHSIFRVNGNAEVKITCTID